VIAWSTFSFAGMGLLLLGVQSLLNVVPVGPEIVTFSLILLVPAAVGSVYGQARNVFLDTGWRTRVLLGLAVLALLGAFPTQYMYRPAVLREGLPPDAPRIVAEREAARRFSDPGGRVLADPRFTATFLLQAGIDPRRLLTPFDAGFPSWVASPPADVTTVVVTEHPDDLVGGNYPALRLLRQLPDMRLESESRAGTTDVRAFVRAPVELPSADAPRAVLEPYASAEDRLLSAVRLARGCCVVRRSRPSGAGPLPHHVAGRRQRPLHRRLARQTRRRSRSLGDDGDAPCNRGVPHRGRTVG
jgi:hypothetical protein